MQSLISGSNNDTLKQPATPEFPDDIMELTNQDLDSTITFHDHKKEEGIDANL